MFARQVKLFGVKLAALRTHVNVMVGRQYTLLPAVSTIQASDTYRNSVSVRDSTQTPLFEKANLAINIGVPTCAI